jgi:outer membrane protein OmpA-like peptidoglycan-associated protein
MTLRTLLNCSTLLLLAPVLHAQSVQWASEVISFTSEYSGYASSAQQILGRPNALPAGGDSPMAWAVGKEDDEGHESTDEATITVGFAKPTAIRQVAIGESNAPGAITRVALIDVDDVEHEVYTAVPQAIDAKTRMLNIVMEKTSYRVRGVSITMQPGEVAGWNELDAVGISETEDPIRATINIVPNLTAGSKPENLGRSVNSEADELVDAIAPDGKTLYISRKDHPGNVGDEQRRDVWYSTLQPDGSWSEAVNIGPPINNEMSNFANSITPDGNSLLLSGLYNDDGSFRAQGLSISHRTASGWSLPEDMVIDDWYNDGDISNYALSPDQKVLLMSLKRKENYGNNDLYVSFLQRDGTWSKPVNMGPVVNTIGTDMAPFIAADGVTLYYSTNGLSGYGGNDIFLTRRLDDSWTKWSEPQNLGPSINTTSDDAFYTLTAAGDYAYFSSATDTYGASDIFRIALPKAVRPKPVILVRGTVFDAKTRQPIAANIHYESLPGGKEAGIARSSPASGEYKIALPAGSNFGFRAEAKGYYAVSENLNTTEIEEYREIQKDLYLAPIEVGMTVRLNNIVFETGKWDLKPESFPELDRVVQLLNENAKIRIAIAGHTDNVGSDADNMNLSKNRARSVLDYLASHGVEAGRLASAGYGETKPIATNDTDDGRQMNRRVEFTIISN